jgi:hypothetical protein
MNRARTLDYRDRELKAYLVLMDLIPALERAILRKLARSLGDRFPGIQAGRGRAPQFRDLPLHEQLREAGLEFVA